MGSGGEAETARQLGSQPTATLSCTCSRRNQGDRSISNSESRRVTELLTSCLLSPRETTLGRRQGSHQRSQGQAEGDEQQTLKAVRKHYMVK